VGTPFEGGLFKMKLVLGSDFPNAPPKGTSLYLHAAKTSYSIRKNCATHVIAPTCNLSVLRYPAEALQHDKASTK